MPEWLATALTAAVPGALLAAVAWGAMTARLRRVEADVANCVVREVYNAQSNAITERLTRIEAMLERVLDRTPRRHDDPTP